MIYYVFNNNKPLKEVGDNRILIVHHCDKCNLDFVGEWDSAAFMDKDLEMSKEITQFANKKKCLVCNAKFSEMPEHHCINYGRKDRESILLCHRLAKGYPSSRPGEDRKDILLGNLVLDGSFHVLPSDQYCLESDLLNYNAVIPSSGEEVLTEMGIGIMSGDSFIRKDGKMWQIFFHDTTPESFVAALGKILQKNRREQAQKQLTELENKYSFDRSQDIEKKSQIEDKEKLKEYLGNLLLIEKNIFSLSRRLEELYFWEIVFKKDAFGSEKVPLFYTKQKLQRALEQQKRLKAKKVEDIEIKYPKKPTKPEKPTEPILAKPGIFNKKRILAENAALTDNYQRELEKYTLSIEKYHLDLEKYNTEVTLLEEKRQQDHQAAIAKADLSITKIQEKLKMDENSIQNLPSPEKAKHVIVQKEIKTVEDLLKKFYEARNHMYSCGVLFEKYRNFVAVSSLYEYLTSGRCDSLTGPHGAYNLYESEIRMNRVIEQLNMVIESLEAIKQNQFIIYSAIQDTNLQLNRLNGTTKQVFSALETINSKMTNMESYLDEIADNTAVIAYNTEQTAFYSKKNAELTDAMGFLVALK
ncbi:MAG: hypothetical protein J6D16_01825 [Clostridia bacterium]|nr:hypothetical protein [Clostridia bacterium]